MKKNFVPSLELNHNSLMFSQTPILCALPPLYYVMSVSGLSLCGLHVPSSWHVEDYRVLPCYISWPPSASVYVVSYRLW